ncbi:uncharacterized protein LOC143190109 [Rhynchophorus ferrugineus]|uniref:MORN repeat-containing protein 5 n=1 Tax=Rhynchophorus ferrugineus TaxID=354439 RepID=A0A834MJ13_RHYFE|nr:hypothetical protein GWI33_003762 [Rhynchophorus ferrugineus]
MSVSGNNFSQIRPTLTPDWEKVGLHKRISPTRKRKKGDSGESHIGFLQYEKPEAHFVTGSTYEGCWDSIGIAGYGTYTFPHGAVYVGYFKDGQFHGKGTITYPMGHKLKGLWKHGKLISKLFYFADGLKYKEPWLYCKMPDRRFQIEFNTSLRGGNKEFLTNRQPTVKIPEGCYDTVDGFYDSSVNCIYSYDEEAIEQDNPTLYKRCTDSLKRTVLDEESNFIKTHYRNSSIGPIGYSPKLYEYWMKGTEDEVCLAMTELKLADKEASQISISSDAVSSCSNIQVQLEICELLTK